MWKCADPELERQIRCFPYGECSDVLRLQQVEQKAEEFRTTIPYDHGGPNLVEIRN